MNITLETNTTMTVAPDHNPRRRFLTPLPERGEFLLVLDNTAFGYITSCPRSAQYYMIAGRESQVKGSALTFGGAIHAGLETYLKGKKVFSGVEQGERVYQGLTPCESNEEFIARQDAAIMQYFADHPAPITDHRTPLNALEVMKHYRNEDRLPQRQWEILRDAEGPIIERSFELPLCVVEMKSWIAMPWLTAEELQVQAVDPETNKVHVSRIHVAWSGRIDVIANHHGANRVVDHKTSSITDATTIADFHLSNQTRGYVWAAQQLWPKHNISGFCVNFLSLKKPTGTGGLMRPGPRGGAAPLSFTRNFFEYDEGLISEWEHNAKTIIGDFLHCVARNDFPQYTKSCCGRFSLCQYHPVCTSVPSRRAALLGADSLYKQVTWNPTNGK